MNYLLLGNSGLRVSEICLGTMTFGTQWGYGTDYNGSKALFQTFVEAGGNFFDTANRYTEGISEEYLGKILQATGLRHQSVIASKFSLRTGQGNPNDGGNHRKNMVQSLEGSLKRLKTEYLDIFYLHAWDFSIRPEELMYNLEHLLRAGKILHVAFSDMPAWVFAACTSIASERHYGMPVALQGEYSLLNRDMERDMIPAANHFNVPILAWGALAGGAFSGKYLRGETGRVPEHSLRRSEKANRLAGMLNQESSALNIPAVALALRWVMEAPGTTVPIVGARTPEQLTESLKASQIQLRPEFRNALHEASAISYGFPHEFLLGDQVRQLQLGPKPDALVPLPKSYRNVLENHGTH